MATFTEQEIDRILEALRQAVASEGSQRRAAKVLGLTQQHISRLLRTPRHPQDRPGVHIARRLAAYMGITEEELLTGQPPEVGPRLRELPGWWEARQEAQKRLPVLRNSWLDLVGEIRHPRPPRLSADFLASLAMTWATAENAGSSSGLKSEDSSSGSDSRLP